MLYAVVDQLPRSGKRELVFLRLFACSFVVSVSWRFLFLLVLGMGCALLLWHSLGLPLIIFYKLHAFVLILVIGNSYVFYVYVQSTEDKYV